MRRWLGVLVVACLLPVASAGTASEPDVVDPAGDVSFNGAAAPHPCADAVDLLTFWVEWTAEGALFHYRFTDLSAVQGTPPQDLAGRCFYSYADFVLERANGPDVVDSVYMDYNGNAAFQTGWRFYLHESQAEVIGAVDNAAGTIDVLVPLPALGDPGPGDSLGQFFVQSVTTLAGLGYDYAGDFAPDDGPCECPVPFPGTVPTNATESESSSSSSTGTGPGASSSSSTSAGTTARPPAPLGNATASGSGSSTASSPAAKDSPAPGWVLLVALAAVAALRRRRR